ncbi:MAG TPA: hypothetical protein GXZ48_00405 [Acholeplasmataceae bacterium]|nr:hypothetical protein [Acholeplasmataceae bacterium]
MILHKTNKYLRDCKKLKRKNRKELLINIEKIENVLIYHDNFYGVVNSPFYKIYNFEQLVGNREGYYSARIGGAERIIFKPVGEKPYNHIEIEEIILEEISVKHYKK